jgi:plastocyanin
MKHFCAAIVLTCVVVLAGCGGGGSSPSTSTMTAPTPTPTPASPVSVGIPMGAQFLTTTSYIPDTVSVSVGTTVKWTNNDSIAHTATSQNNLWGSGDLEPGATFSYTFQSAGTFPYYCVYHPGMVGTITVQ